MKLLPAFISKDAGFKILALVLAIVVYYVLRDAANTSRYSDPPSLMKGAVDAER